jgi:hypothetical protein
MKLLKYIVIILLAIILLLISWLKIGDIFYHKERNAIVNKIDQFYVVNNRLPNSLQEIGISNEDYQYDYKIDETKKAYYFYVNTSVGEFDTYDSKSKTWNK